MKLDRETKLYLDLVRKHPRPTSTQIRSFTDFVSNDHSRYKRLPIAGQGEPFFLYLRPHVHEALVDTLDGGQARRPVTVLSSDAGPILAIAYELGDVHIDESEIAPLSYTFAVPSVSYRERYGLLSYWNHGEPDQPREAALAAAKRGLTYRDDGGSEHRVPAAVLAEGLVYLRATVSPGRFDRTDEAAERIALCLPTAQLHGKWISPLVR